MGIYDTYGDVQIKVGEVACRNFEIGDKSPLPDGIYIGLEAAIVIKNGIFVAQFKTIIDKWGNEYCCSEIIDPNHPLKEIL